MLTTVRVLRRQEVTVLIPEQIKSLKALRHVNSVPSSLKLQLVDL